MDDTVGARMAADRDALQAHGHGGLDDLHTELDKSPIHEAARENDLDTLRELIETDNTAVNTLDKYKFTALHWAADRGHAEAATYLLDHGADANSVEKRLFRRTPLHFAAVAPSLAVVRVLLKHGADANAVEYRGWSAVHYAAHAGAIDVVRALLDAGADVRRQTNAGETAHEMAANAGHDATEMLAAREAGGDMDASEEGKTASHVASLAHGSLSSASYGA